ncbi:MAG: sensor histidine kinase [Chloroflexota bacterium]
MLFRHAVIAEHAYQAGAVHESAQIGLDLHDTVLQELSYLRLQADRARLGLAHDSPEVEAFLKELGETLQAAGNDLRRLATGLVANPSSPVLAEALREVGSHFSRRWKGKLDFASHGSPRTTPAKVRSQLVRLLGEALNNVRKHADAKVVNVTLDYRQDAVSLSIADDGCGFDTMGDGGGGLGMAGMIRRVAALHGTMHVQSSAGQGTKLTFEVPY